MADHKKTIDERLKEIYIMTWLLFLLVITLNAYHFFERIYSYQKASPQKSITTIEPAIDCLMRVEDPDCKQYYNLVCKVKIHKE